MRSEIRYIYSAGHAAGLRVWRTRKKSGELDSPNIIQESSAGMRTAFSISLSGRTFVFVRSFVRSFRVGTTRPAPYIPSILGALWQPFRGLTDSYHHWDNAELYSSSTTQESSVNRSDAEIALGNRSAVLHFARVSYNDFVLYLLIFLGKRGISEFRMA